MNFQFKVNINDQDYLDYNMFYITRSPYGKKLSNAVRIIATALFAITILIYLYSGNFTVESFLCIMPMLIILLITQIFFIKFYSWSLKSHIKSLKRSGERLYSPESVIEFFDDIFIETTPDNKTEQKYSVIDRVSIVDNNMIYIHINRVMAYMLPLSCFESKELYDNFLRFLETKCSNINIYK